MFDEQFSPLTYDDIDFSMRAEKCKLRVATTRIPQVSKFMGGSSELYSNNAKKQFFKEAASRNIGKILDIHSDLISQNKRSILAEQIVDIYTPSIC